jgi:hypothetical protein
VSQSLESLSITTPEASNDGQGSMGETLSVCSDVDNDRSLFCAVLYKMCPPTNSATWHATGLVGTNFQKKLKCTTEEGKDRFRNSRDEVITEGLVEMGRRKLESSSKDIVVAPYFSGNAVPKRLSSENYLRLTEKGTALGKEVIESYHLNLNFAAPSKNLKTTVYISNLPRNVQVNALVEFIEQTFQLVVQRACVDPLCPAAKVASAHIEFQTEQEAKKIFELSKAQDDAGLVYAGRALRTYPDRKSPNWSKCHPKALFRRKQREIVAEYSNEDRERKNDIAGQKDLVVDKVDLSITKEPTSTSICDTTADLTTVPSPPKYTAPTEISEDTRTKLENLDTSDLLFGDNLTLLYAQTADYHMDDTADTEHPPVSIPFFSGGAVSMSDALVSPIRKAPDLHW